MFIPVLDV